MQYSQILESKMVNSWEPVKGMFICIAILYFLSLSLSLSSLSVSLSLHLLWGSAILWNIQMVHGESSSLGEELSSPAKSQEALSPANNHVHEPEGALLASNNCNPSQQIVCTVMREPEPEPLS